MSVQYVAAASQKLTSPAVTAVPPAATVAVNVTTVPDGTVLTVAPFDEIATVVVVAVKAQVCCEPPQRNADKAAARHNRLGILTCALARIEGQNPVKRGHGILMATLLQGSRCR
jgi:hypothetical protein